MVALALLPTTAIAETVNLRVAGNLSATGIIQQTKEQPFFETLSESTGLPITVQYQPMDVVGIKDVEGLRVLKSGLFDIVTLRVGQVSRDDPFLIGMDLAGLNSSYEMARDVADAYRGPFDERLKQQFNGKLLGLWPFGPQVMFCNGAISSLDDIAGRKIRVGDKTLADLIETLGGIPVTLAFGEVQQALARGVTDCAITGPSSANTAGWPEITTHLMPISFFVAYNVYAINLDTWNKFTPEQQQTLQDAFATFEADTWAFSEELYEDAMRCNVGDTPCTTVKSYDLELVPVSQTDLDKVQDAVRTTSFPAWAQLCDATYPGCSDLWRKTVGPLVGFE